MKQKNVTSLKSNLPERYKEYKFFKILQSHYENILNQFSNYHDFL